MLLLKDTALLAENQVVCSQISPVSLLPQIQPYGLIPTTVTEHQLQPCLPHCIPLLWFPQTTPS